MSVHGSASTSNHLEILLQQNFQLSSFRGGQRDAITATLNGLDSLVILPTGAGKSLTFQFPPFTRPYAFTVVVSPLLALARDQVEQACERGIDARSWNSEITEPQRLSIIRELCNSELELKLLYVTPESLRQPRLRDALKEANDLGTLLSFAVDEAHCISQWGHDFRPAYLELSTLKQDFPTVPIACLTASCTARVQSSIVEILGLRNVALIKSSFNRPNIQYEVLYKDLVADGSEEAIMQDIINYVKAHPEQCGIIYARLRTTCDSIGKALEGEDLDVAVYHAGKDARQRNRVQSDWSSGAIQVVVATVAFGMGVDKPDVRWVIHYNAPASMEGFYQESGRAGRDGQPCSSLVYASQSDLEVVAKLERGNRSGAVSEVNKLLMSGLCRRKQLLAFFGESRAACSSSGGEQVCDYCRDPAGVSAKLCALSKAQERSSVAAAVRARMAQGREGAAGDADMSRPLCTWSTAKQDGQGQGAAAGPSPAASILAEPLFPEQHHSNAQGHGTDGARVGQQLVRPTLRCVSGSKRAADPDPDQELQHEGGAGAVPDADLSLERGAELQPLADAAPSQLLRRTSGLSRPQLKRRAAPLQACPGRELEAVQQEPGPGPGPGDVKFEAACGPRGLLGSRPGEGSCAEDEENVPPATAPRSHQPSAAAAASVPRGISIGLKAPRRAKRCFEPPLKDSAA